MEHEMTPYLQLMKGLPPLVSVVIWDVTVLEAHDRIDELTVKLGE